MLIVADPEALSVVPNPTGFETVTSGTAEYPFPPLLMTNEEIVPATDTTAVAAAATKVSWDVISIFFGSVFAAGYSLALSKNVLTLSTKITEEVTPTLWMIFVVGWITGS